MYPIDRERDIRELEVFLFGGIPEIPQPVFERDANRSSHGRMTREAVITQGMEMIEDPMEPLSLGVIRINEETGELVVLDPPGKGDAKG